jgi:2-amino-4-hydroxy-6-hydroxymethyldihydropteridine diphosphokinase
MTQAFVGIGSNIDRENSIRGGIARLREEFGPLLLSTIYESPAYGFEGDNFYNLIAGFETSMTPGELTRELHAIEGDLGRKREQRRYTSRTLDLDLLLYGDLVCHEGAVDVPREDIVKFAFVLRPLAEIAGGLRHPETGATFTEMWESFDQPDQTLWPVEIGEL